MSVGITAISTYLVAGLLAVAGIILSEHLRGKWAGSRSAFDYLAILFAVVAWPWATYMYCAELLERQKP